MHVELSDTGDRDISALFGEGAITAGRVLLRRQGGLIFWQFASTVFAASFPSSRPPVALPAGWGAGEFQSGPVYRNGGAAPPMIVQPYNRGLYVWGMSPGIIYKGQVIVPAQEPFPAPSA